MKHKTFFKTSVIAVALIVALVGSSVLLAGCEDLARLGGQLVTCLFTLGFVCPDGGGGGGGLDYNVINGDDSDNTLIGTPLIDAMDGKGGDDTLMGLGADDVLVGGTGDDTLYGGEGNDAFYFGGTFGADSIGTTTTSDIGPGDTVVFTDDTELSYSYSGTDLTIAQGANRVTIYDANSASGARVVGGGQVSLVDFILQQRSTSYSVIVGTAGNDGVFNTSDPSMTTRLIGASEADILLGLDGIDFIEGGEEDDMLYGGAGNDNLRGDEGNDLLVGGRGNDVLYGGGGDFELLLGGAADNAQGSDTFRFGANFGEDSIGIVIGSVSAYGIDATDTLVFDSTTDLSLAWNGDHLAITQGSDRVIIYGATDATNDGGFTIRWNGITERVDSTADTTVGS